MTFNVDKCHVLIVSRNRKQIVIDFSLHGRVLENIEKATYHGVELTKDLSWGPTRPYCHSQSEQDQHIHLSKPERESLTHHSSNKVLQRQCTLSSENTSPVWDPQQKHLQGKLEMVH